MGDWDGDGTKTPGVVRGNLWYLRNTNTPGVADIVFAYGVATDIPIAGDWDGDGIDSPGVVREHVTFYPPDGVGIGADTWHLRNSNSPGFGEINFMFANPGSPVVGDWDGDGDDGVGMVADGGISQVYDPSNKWELDTDLDGTADTEFTYGRVGDFPIAGDWDGDELESVGVVRGNRWFLKNENTGGPGDVSFFYGTATDIPLVWGDGP